MLLTPHMIPIKEAAQFLRLAYEQEHNAQHGILSALALGRALGLSEQESRCICTYLAERGFIDCLSQGHQLRLTLKGKVDVEWALANPCFLHDLFNETVAAPARHARP